MATIPTTVTLEEIVNTVKLRTGITDHYKIMSIATSLLQEFNLHYRQTKKAVEISANGKHYIELPADFVEYVKIGYVMQNGEIETLTKNDRLVNTLSMIAGDEYTWTEEQEVDVCIDPYSTEANEIVEIPT